MTNEEAQKSLAAFEAEDRAEDAARAEFVEMGRSHARYAIDCLADDPDARSSYETNLFDTLADNHKGAKQSHLDAAVDAYNAAWNVFLHRQNRRRARRA